LKGSFTDVEILIQRFNDKPADSNERIVFFTGKLQNIINAQEVMLNILKMKRPNFDRINSNCNEVRIGDNEVLFRGVITWRLTGLLIGKDGSNIKAIHNETGCWIKIGHTEERVRGSSERYSINLSLYPGLMLMNIIS
jgi:tetrahydromethanopterin S-methyltransferase subunit F